MWHASAATADHLRHWFSFPLHLCPLVAHASALVSHYRDLARSRNLALKLQKPHKPRFQPDLDLSRQDPPSASFGSRCHKHVVSAPQRIISAMIYEHCSQLDLLVSHIDLSLCFWCACRTSCPGDPGLGAQVRGIFAACFHGLLNVRRSSRSLLFTSTQDHPSPNYQVFEIDVTHATDYRAPDTLQNHLPTVGRKSLVPGEMERPLRRSGAR